MRLQQILPYAGRVSRGRRGFASLVFAVVFAGYAHADDPLIPTEYVDLYPQIEGPLNSFQPLVDARWNGALGVKNVFTQSNLVNCNIGTQLLTNPLIFDNMLMEVLAIKRIGQTGVNMPVHFPLFHQPYFDWVHQHHPGSEVDPYNASDFINFYKGVMQRLRDPNHPEYAMKVGIEAHVMFKASISGVQELPYLEEYFATMGWNGYKAGRSAHVVSVARNLQPEYLMLLSEPSTEANLSGYSEPEDETEAAAFVQLMLTDLKNANAATPFGLHTKVLTGAGVMSGEYNRYASLIDAELNMPELDIFDVHIYPVNAISRTDLTQISVMFQLADQAVAHGKKLSIGESWLYKQRDSEKFVSPLALYGRDPWSFWYSVDINFHQSLLKLANLYKMEFVNLYWDRQYFATLDYYHEPNCPANPTPTSPNNSLGCQSGDTEQRDETLAAYANFSTPGWIPTPLGSKLSDMLVGKWAPEIVTPAAAASYLVNGNSVSLSVRGATSKGQPDNGSNLTYSWRSAGLPGLVSFSASGSNAAKNTVATFSQPGVYNLIATIQGSDGQTMDSLMPAITVTLPGNQPPAFVSGPSATPNPVTGTTTSLSVQGTDDGGESKLTYTWKVLDPAPAPVSFSVNGTNPAKTTVATFKAAGDYTFQVTLKDAGGFASAASLNVTVDADLTTVLVTPASAIVPPLGQQQFMATGLDQFGTAMAPQPNVNRWMVARSGTSGTIDSVGLFTASSQLGGPYTVTAWMGYTTGTADVTISNTGNQPPTVATPAKATPSPVTGTTTALSVLGTDDRGENSLTYTWATMGTPPAAVSFSGNGTNAAKTTTATFTKAGSYNFQVTLRDAGGLTATSSVIVTVNQTLTSIQVTPASASVAVGATQVFSASAKDQFGDAMTSLPVFGWSVSGGGTITSSGLFTAGSTPGGPFTVTAASAGQTGTASVTVTALPNQSPTVATPAKATPSPVTGTTTALSVLGTDDRGENSLTYTWATMGTPPAAVSFSANGTNAAKTTTATFTKAGSYNFQVTLRDAGGLTVISSVNVTVSQTLTSIQVTPASASVAVGATQVFSASAKDQFGGAMTSLPVFGWSVSGGGTITSSGLFTAGSTPGGPFTVTAASAGQTGTASVTVTALPNQSPTVATPAKATPSPVTGTTTALSVLGTDDRGESSLTYTWATMGTPPAAVSFSGNGTNAAKTTTATFTKAGSYSFQVTLRDAGGLTVISSVNVTVSQTLTSIQVTPASASVAVGATQVFSAGAKDQFGDAMTSLPVFGWSVSGGGTITSSGLFTAGSTPGGPFTVTAASAGQTGTASVTVTALPNQSPTVATPAKATPSPVTGTTTALSVLGTDDRGENSLTYTWATMGTPPAAVSFSANGTNAAKTTTATFTKAGSYNFQVTLRDAGGLTVISSVNVTVSQTLTSIQVTPASASVAVGATQVFSASAKDQFGGAMTSLPVFGWSVSGGGTITSSGLFTAGSTPGGPFTVTAASAGQTGTASVTVTALPNQSPTVATPAKATPSPVTGTTTALSVLGTDDRGESSLTYTWATMGTPPAAVSFSGNGTNAAKTTTATFTKAGSYNFQVTLRDAGGLTVTSSVIVPVNQTLTSIEVTPASVSVMAGATQSFTAGAIDQFGQSMTLGPVLWTGGGGGTITVGLFTAGNIPGTFTVTATKAGHSGAATVTVTAGGLDPVAPTVSILSIPDASTVSGVVSVTLSVADNVGVVKAELYVDHGLVDTATDAPFSLTWDSTGSDAGTHSLGVHVYDAAGNIGETELVVVTAPSPSSGVAMDGQTPLVQVYPNPWRGNRHQMLPVKFGSMPLGSTVNIFTVTGHHVKTLDSSSGSASWDLTTDSGDKAASGIYLYVVTDSSGSSTRGKVAVIH